MEHRMYYACMTASVYLDLIGRKPTMVRKRYIGFIFPTATEDPSQITFDDLSAEDHALIKEVTAELTAVLLQPKLLKRKQKKCLSLSDYFCKKISPVIFAN